MTSIARVVTKWSLKSRDTDVSYWRERSPAERLAMVEELRRRHHGWDDDLDPSFSGFFASLHARRARFPIIGGYAVGMRGRPRYTADLDSGFVEAYEQRAEGVVLRVQGPRVAVSAAWVQTWSVTSVNCYGCSGSRGTPTWASSQLGRRLRRWWLVGHCW